MPSGMIEAIDEGVASAFVMCFLPHRWVRGTAMYSQSKVVPGQSNAPADRGWRLLGRRDRYCLLVADSNWPMIRRLGLVLLKTLGVRRTGELHGQCAQSRGGGAVVSDRKSE